MQVSLSSKRMKILLTQKNLFAGLGGGESASFRYWNLCSSSTVYHVTDTPGSVQLPQHFQEVSFDVKFFDDLKMEIARKFNHKDQCWGDFQDYAYAKALAESVKGQHFDIVETGDYLTYPRFLRQAFSKKNISVGKYVLALHGRVSRTIALEQQIGCFYGEDHVQWLQAAEHQCFETADVRYGISRRYAGDLRSGSLLPVELIDPLLAIPGIQAVHVNSPSSSFPVYIGRIEWGKGPDLMVQIAWKLRDLFQNQYEIYGSSARLFKPSLLSRLAHFCSNRGFPFHYKGPQSYTEIVENVFGKPAIVVIPSRADTFNLVALEAFFHGCPIVLSQNTGAAVYFEEHYPNHPAVRMVDPENLEAQIAAVRAIEKDYYAIRKQLVEELSKDALHRDFTSFLRMLESDPVSSRAQILAAGELYDRLDQDLAEGEGSPVKELGDFKGMLFHVSARGEFLEKLVNPLTHGIPTNPYSSRNDLPAFDLFRGIQKVLAHKDRSREKELLKILYSKSPILGRFDVLSALAEVEFTYGNADIWAAYQLRLLRGGQSLSRDTLLLLSETLNALNFVEEARVVEFADDDSYGSSDRVFKYLNNRRLQFMQTEEPVEEYCRKSLKSAQNPRASIIVSLYEVDPRHLRFFVSTLARDPLLLDSKAEIIFVDSGSPTPQVQWLLGIQEASLFPWKLIRSFQRETIQMAWNRGIKAANAPYITFLGVDEGMREDALGKLCDYLDNHESINWVMADAIVQNVGHNGQWCGDVLKYRRTNLNSSLCMYDCTYLGYVGGLYRKSLHLDAGLYDPFFRGAGDTEFKCRVNPYLKLAHYPETLGLFNNFPSDRITNSAKIEIEDLRAWYLFRTKGGAAYLYERKDQQELESVFWSILTGKRTWIREEAEGDLFFGAHVLNYLISRYPDSGLSLLQKPIQRLKTGMIAMQSSKGDPYSKSYLANQLLVESVGFFKECRSIREDLEFPEDLRSDLVFSAHSWLWNP